jgi:hypothetical protein
LTFSAIGGDQCDGVAILNTVGKAVRREPAEHDGMDGADSGAGQQRHGGFDDHGQIDGNHVAFFDAALRQRIGKAADFLVQFLVGDMAGGVGVIAFPDDRGLVAAFGQMPVQAVGGHVQRAVLEPFDRDIAFEGGVFDFGGCFDPVEALAFPGPERVRLRGCLGCHFLVFFGGDQRVGGDFRFNGDDIRIRHARSPIRFLFSGSVTLLP